MLSTKEIVILLVSVIVVTIVVSVITKITNGKTPKT